MATFSTTDEAIINHQVELDPALSGATSAQTGRSIEELYEIESTAKQVVEGRFREVALQFPDEALIDSVPAFWALKSRIDQIRAGRTTAGEEVGDEARAGPSSHEDRAPNLYVLADTSYGNCCVDEVAAQHVNADLVVHYGHACLSPTARLPVIYVFTKRDVSVSHAVDSLSDIATNTFFAPNSAETKPKALVLMYDVGYAHAIDQVYRGLKRKLSKRPAEDEGDIAAAAGTEDLDADGELDVLLVLSQIDRSKNFDDKLAQRAEHGTGPSGTGSMPSNGACSRGEGQCCGGEASTACGGGQAQKNGPTTCCGGTNGFQVPPSQGSATQTGDGCAACSAPVRTSGSRDDTTAPNGAGLCTSSGPSRTFTLPSGVSSLSECAILYVGGESLALTNLMLTSGPACQVVSYDPATRSTRVETGRTNRLLMRRYALIQAARDASVIGLLVGTLGVHSYLPLLAHLRKILRSRRSARKVYTVSVGKLNPAKLANFQEVECWVLVACPENTLVESKEFYKPIVTPYEMELALDENREWTGEYVLDLARLVPTEARGAARTDGDGRVRTQDEELDAGGPEDDAEEDEGEDDGRPHFSLKTGTYVSRTRYGQKEDEQASTSMPDAESGIVALRSSDGTISRVLDSASHAHLSGRTWRGLEQRVGMDEPSPLEEGRAGIAKGYQEADGTREGTERRTEME